MKTKPFLSIIIALILVSCHQAYEPKTVICIPVYGQSLALGEEAERMTDFDSLANYADGRIVTENLDHQFGYFDNNDLKEFAKKRLGYQKRSFELSIYNMAKVLADATGSDTIICIFPGGQGATAIANLSKGTVPYQKFMEKIAIAHQGTISRGWDFRIPAICWMQGESDIVDYPSTDYQQLLTRIQEDMNNDIRQLTSQQDTIPFICYQPNSLTRAEHFKADAYLCRETSVPMTFVNLLNSDDRYWASGPTYPYACVNEKIHIDAAGQQSIGALAARSALGIIRDDKRFQGLTPATVSSNGNEIEIHFNNPTLPLTFDTVQVSKADNYGFSVISKDNRYIATTVTINGDVVNISCSEPAEGCKVRYAVNGDYMKSGNLHGPRGNLRDGRGNWCYQFDIKVKDK
ncbi:MAG: hypothetical protein IJ588_01980 [Prevotella sp.]|nr:hypothetical protein [Prevotella sp.]